MGATRELISSSSGLRLVLEPTDEVHDLAGRRHVNARGRIAKFSGGRALVPEEWVEDVRAHPEYGRMVWLADDSGAPMPASGPDVVSGALGASYRHTGSPPGRDFDEVGAKEIARRLAAGLIPDLAGAMAWEVAHRNRAQVVNAISSAIRAGAGEAGADPGEDDAEPMPESFSAPAPPFMSKEG